MRKEQKSLSPVEKTLADKNRRTARIVVCVLVFMLGLSFASVPLYSLFCKVTGFDGTPTEAALPDKVLEREITVQFNADISPGIPWNFKPDQPNIKVRLGQQALISFTASNMAAQPTAGTAIYNVTPPKVGKYFHKIQCFCFGEQILPAGGTANMPVLFFVDPKMADDRNMADVNLITLSYTFYKTDSAELERAQKDFYNRAPEPGTPKQPAGVQPAGKAKILTE